MALFRCWSPNLPLDNQKVGGQKERANADIRTIRSEIPLYQTYNLG